MENGALAGALQAVDTALTLNQNEHTQEEMNIKLTLIRALILEAMEGN